MLSKEDFAVIKALNGLGVYQKDIAAHLGVHPKTVQRALQRDRAPALERQKRGSKLDPVPYTHLDVYKRQTDYCSVVRGTRMQALLLVEIALILLCVFYLDPSLSGNKDENQKS